MSELKRMIDQVAREKGLDREILINTLEEAMRSAARRKLGSKVEVDVAYNAFGGRGRRSITGARP